MRMTRILAQFIEVMAIRFIIRFIIRTQYSSASITRVQNIQCTLVTLVPYISVVGLYCVSG
jgi:hypothetical protein